MGSLDLSAVLGAGQTRLFVGLALGRGSDIRHRASSIIGAGRLTAPIPMVHYGEGVGPGAEVLHHPRGVRTPVNQISQSADTVIG